VTRFLLLAAWIVRYTAAGAAGMLLISAAASVHGWQVTGGAR
jgi:hypothetical protein